jgi:hypothetical protein
MALKKGRAPSPTPYPFDLNPTAQRGVIDGGRQNVLAEPESRERFRSLYSNVPTLEQVRSPRPYFVTGSAKSERPFCADKAGDTRRRTRNTVAVIVREHNGLNGFGIAGFILLIVAALLISAGGVQRGLGVLAGTGFGIAVNAGALIAIAASQIRDHEESEGLLKLRSPEFRARSSGQVPI